MCFAIHHHYFSVSRFIHRRLVYANFPPHSHSLHTLLAFDWHGYWLNRLSSRPGLTFSFLATVGTSQPPHNFFLCLPGTPDL